MLFQHSELDRTCQKHVIFFFVRRCVMNRMDDKCAGVTVHTDSLSHSNQIIFDLPVFGDLQLCDVSLNECHVAVVTIVRPVFLHKALHEIHSCHVFGFGQQVAGVATAQTHVDECHCLWIIKAPRLNKQTN